MLKPTLTVYLQEWMIGFRREIMNFFKVFQYNFWTKDETNNGIFLMFNVNKKP